MYLSSFRLGDRPGELVRLLGERTRVGVIANSIDGPPPPGVSVDSRQHGVQQEVDDLASLGLDADEVDLRTYFGRPDDLAASLAEYGGLWLRGGNAFVLRAAMRLSGADDVISELVRRDAIVYAGYSAGPCVLAPSLRGLELVDHPEAVRDAYGVEPLWDGLGLIDFAFVPHYRSPGHPETADIENVAAHYRANGVEHRTLHDGEALVVEGDRITLV